MKIKMNRAVRHLHVFIVAILEGSVSKTTGGRCESELPKRFEIETQRPIETWLKLQQKGLLDSADLTYFRDKLF